MSSSATLSPVTEQEGELSRPVAKTVGLALALVAFAVYLFGIERGVGGLWFSLLAFGVVVRGFGRWAADGRYDQPLAAWIGTYAFCLGVMAFGVLLILGGLGHGSLVLGVVGVVNLVFSLGMTWFWVRTHLAARRLATRG